MASELEPAVPDEHPEDQMDRMERNAQRVRQMQQELAARLAPPPAVGGPIEFMSRGPFLGCASPFIVLTIGISTGFSHDAGAALERSAIIGGIVYGIMALTWRGGLDRALQIHPHEAPQIEVPSYARAIALTVFLGDGAVVAVAMLVYWLRQL